MTPRTKIISGVAAVAILGGGVFFLRTGRTEIKYNSITPEQASKAAEGLSKDQDNDGLKDWEEELWNTNPLNKDTDGDGTVDGEEITLGRDPVKAGPDDELDQKTIEAKTVPGGGDWTETDRLSREFFAKYLTIKQSGVPFTAEEEEKLLADFTQRYPEPRAKKIFTESDIVLAKNDDVASLRAYGNAIGTVINAHKEKEDVENELIIFERALENEDALDLQNLDGRVKRYESILAGFKTIPAPRNVMLIHLDLLNSIESIKESVDGMAGALTDSVRALSAATAYPAAIEDLTKALDDIARFFEMKQITFGKDEPGAILTQ